MWGPGTIDSSGDVGRSCSIAIGTDGREQICYWDQTNRDLKFAEWKFGTPDGHWAINAIAHGDVQGKCSLALDKNNNPHMSYTGDRTGGGSDVRYIYRIGSGGWNTQWVLRWYPEIHQTSIAVEKVSGRVGISYDQYGRGSIYYVKRNPTTGAWSNPTLMDTTGYISESALALDKNKQPAISYPASDSAGNRILQFAYRDAAGWHKLTADNGGSAHAGVGNGASLAIGSGNIPSISYRDFSNSKLKYTEGHATSTAMTCTVTPTSVVVNQAFTVKGKLTSGSTALSKEAVHLERRALTGGTWGAWANIAGTTLITPANGTISTSQKLAMVGTYQYRWHYAGSIAYKATYSPAVTVTVKKPASFTIATSTTTPTTSVAFTLSGTLKSGSTPLTSKPVHLERRTGTTGTWANVANTYKYTNATGGIKLAQTITTAGTYQYRWHYNGTTTYAAAYSPAVTETVKKPSTLTISTSPTAPKLNVAFTVSGTLKTSTTGLVGYSVHLERKIGSGSWDDVAGTTKTTGTGGTIPLVAQVMTTHGTYSYRWHFTGTTTYKSCYSPVKTFTV